MSKKGTAKLRRERNEKYIDERMTPCASCGFFDTDCMDFHHTDPSTKTLGGISKMKRCGYSIQAIQEEIDKCICLCSNCHRKLHAGRFSSVW